MFLGQKQSKIQQNMGKSRLRSGQRDCTEAFFALIAENNGVLLVCLTEIQNLYLSTIEFFAHIIV